MKHLRRILLSPYHYAWAFLSAAWYGFPARKLTVIGVTGTKGKSSVAEMLFYTLQSEHKTALASTIRFALDKESKPNLYKMTLPGRGFIQKFLAQAIKEGVTHAVIEITSEAAIQHRHAFLFLDALVFTNLEPEHIESHGSMEKYFRAKMRIGTALVRSSKRPRAIIANKDSEYGQRFLEIPVETALPFSFADAIQAQIAEDHIAFTYHDFVFRIPQPGKFSVMNALAVIVTAKWLGLSLPNIAGALSKIERIPGRAERIDEGQTFTVIVDYAHTPESLKALYETFRKRHTICVLGNTGGGRDTWKRPLMGSIADRMCDKVFLTNEDPYDEDPGAIIQAMTEGMEHAPTIIMDRREAIRAALRAAHPGDAVLITGKGTDPYIMERNGKKTPWSDAQVAREELQQLLRH